MSNVTQFPDKYVAENDMLNDVGELVNKYNGRVTNVAMLGVLQATANFVFLSIAEQAIEAEDEGDV
jgi:Pyruvate/2-oxoacid:ferredoxin oxidoreductase gamma subunit|tara:strand:- start:632 stop:829 length:198 start_codon:yes stop_codon:yes gene_type:complete